MVILDLPQSGRHRAIAAARVLRFPAEPSGYQARCCRQRQGDSRRAARERPDLVRQVPGVAAVQPLPGITDPGGGLMRRAGGHAAVATVICHRAELATERKQSSRQSLLFLARVLAELVPRLAQQVAALAPALRRTARSPPLRNARHVLS
jgi:hypothetical protein